MSTDVETVPAVGAAMPDVSLTGPDGRAATLHQTREGHRAVVYFLRAATCPACLKHAQALTALAAEKQLGGDTRVVLVAPGGKSEAAELTKRVSGAVRGWASGDGHAAAGLGSFLVLQHSGTFLVNADGTVAYRRTATLPPKSFSRSELLQALGR